MIHFDIGEYMAQHRGKSIIALKFYLSLRLKIDLFQESLPLNWLIMGYPVQKTQFLTKQTTKFSS